MLNGPRYNKRQTNLKFPFVIPDGAVRRTASCGTREHSEGPPYSSPETRCVTSHLTHRQSDTSRDSSRITFGRPNPASSQSEATSVREATARTRNDDWPRCRQSAGSPETRCVPADPDAGTPDSPETRCLRSTSNGQRSGVASVRAVRHGAVHSECRSQRLLRCGSGGFHRKRGVSPSRPWLPLPIHRKHGVPRTPVHRKRGVVPV